MLLAVVPSVSGKRNVRTCIIICFYATFRVDIISKPCSCKYKSHMCRCACALLNEYTHNWLHIDGSICPIFTNIGRTCVCIYIYVWRTFMTWSLPTLPVSRLQLLINTLLILFFFLNKTISLKLCNNGCFLDYIKNNTIFIEWISPILILLKKLIS